ncbi:MAG: hypothetical protein R8G34_00725 [Paracoccaceae bacterium]|nr:hypothetical protein [Paracoccaceae bacterium]
MKFVVNNDAVDDGDLDVVLVEQVYQPDKATPGVQAYDLHIAVLGPVAVRHDGSASELGIVEQSKGILSTKALSPALFDEGAEAGLVTARNEFF